MAPNVGLGTQGPEQRGWALYLWSIIMVIIAGLFVAVRLSATALRKRLGSDDWTILAALVSILWGLCSQYSHLMLVNLVDLVCPIVYHGD